MRNLIEVKKNGIGCTKGNISCYDVSIIRNKKSKETKNEVDEKYEDDSFLKSMALQIKYEMDKTDEAEYDEQEEELLKSLYSILTTAITGREYDEQEIELLKTLERITAEK
jgi:uncharacterized protein (UPF0305 family)